MHNAPMGRVFPPKCLLLSHIILNVVKIQRQNFHQTSAKKSQSNFSVKVLTKVQLLNLDQDSKSELNYNIKSWQKLSFKISPKLQPKNLD